MKTPTPEVLVLAVHPTMRGFGWALLESPSSPLDWGMVSAKTGRSIRLAARFERLLTRYQPSVVVFEEFESGHAKRSEHVRFLCRNFIHLAHCHGAQTHVFSRAAVRGCFSTIGAKTRFEIAQAIAQRIDVFKRWLPRRRLTWMPQDERQGLFDAVALALTYFAVSTPP